jgi:nucleoside-diphosphate-sugar epimerase
MKVLVTGTDGYIGVLLAPLLLERGHEVVGLDTGLYRDGWLYDPGVGRSPLRLNKDIRHIIEQDLKGCEAVVHLAELSNDPLGQHNPRVTYDINHLGTVALARMCKRISIARFVYTSSCSVYGAGADDHRTETSETNPQTAYVHSKVLVERDLAPMAKETQRDYLLILPWNLVDEITAQMGYIRDWGGQFVVPIPTVWVMP